jgi:REP element-mobilizing transposase RayT
MARKSRIDAAGALHPVMVRGIERRTVFRSDADRNHFLERLGEILRETKTTCYAWSPLPDHFHLLLPTGPVPISTVMRRLLTGYALWYNRRYRRHGHLFQKRYESILCQEDSYFLELVRYIHLNPIRAGLVGDLDELGEHLEKRRSIRGMTKGFWLTGISWGACWHRPRRPWKSAMRSDREVLTRRELPPGYLKC